MKKYENLNSSQYNERMKILFEQILENSNVKENSIKALCVIHSPDFESVSMGQLNSLDESAEILFFEIGAAWCDFIINNSEQPTGFALIFESKVGKALTELQNAQMLHWKKMTGSFDDCPYVETKQQLTAFFFNKNDKTYRAHSTISKLDNVRTFSDPKYEIFEGTSTFGSIADLNSLSEMIFSIPTDRDTIKKVLASKQSID